MGTNLKISPFSHEYRRAKADFIHIFYISFIYFIHLFYTVLRKEERGLWKQEETWRGRYLASGLEPVCKFNSCFYQMGANLPQNQRAVVCTALNLQGKKRRRRFKLACCLHQWSCREFCSCWEVNVGPDCPPAPASLLLWAGYGNLSPLLSSSREQLSQGAVMEPSREQLCSSVAFWMKNVAWNAQKKPNPCSPQTLWGFWAPVFGIPKETFHTPQGKSLRMWEERWSSEKYRILIPGWRYHPEIHPHGSAHSLLSHKSQRMFLKSSGVDVQYQSCKWHQEGQGILFWVGFGLAAFGPVWLRAMKNWWTKSRDWCLILHTFLLSPLLIKLKPRAPCSFKGVSPIINQLCLCSSEASPARAPSWNGVGQSWSLGWTSLEFLLCSLASNRSLARSPEALICPCGILCAQLWVWRESEQSKKSSSLYFTPTSRIHILSFLISLLIILVHSHSLFS